MSIVLLTIYGNVHPLCVVTNNYLLQWHIFHYNNIPAILKHAILYKVKDDLIQGMNLTSHYTTKKIERERNHFYCQLAIKRYSLAGVYSSSYKIQQCYSKEKVISTFKWIMLRVFIHSSLVVRPQVYITIIVDDNITGKQSKGINTINML